MHLSRALAVVGGLVATISLSGCVAAVVPIAAGAVLGKKELDNDPPDNREVAAVASVRPQLAESPLQDHANGQALVLTELTALPPPGPTADARLSNTQIDRFADYALAQSAMPIGSARRESALLAEPATLKAGRSRCDGKPPAVIIDLDPATDTFDPLAPVSANPALEDQLARLRAARVAIFWSTNLAENFVPDLRAVLARSGVDRAGEDRILALSSLDERKQTRREEVAATHCPLAILGDEKADFDELYEYLRNPQNPVAPDAIIGAGWFLANPFVPSVTRAAR
ncbi:MAG: hypothetical protein DI637_10120 [Citromicrobium sp.]|nr:MAG: hypothetical protein DI637_10120 [Citromicrobium sp.]